MASWIQLRIEATADSAPQLESALLQCGALSVTFQDNADQPLLEPAIGTTPLWRQIQLTGLFPADRNTQALRNQLAQHCDAPLPPCQFEVLEDKDWEREWLKNYHPMQFGSSLWIVPSWTTPPDPNATNLLLDPGLAFGTGTHETTALCLEWLGRQPMAGLNVIDYGCGSGILAIAAAKLEAKKVTAIDIDPQALAATKDNANRNNVDIDLFLANEAPQLTADLIVANILCEPLQKLAPLFAKLLKPGGTLVLSGILGKQINEIEAAYQNWFQLDATVSKADWLLISGHRNSQDNR